jgi:hypothetical protein
MKITYENSHIDVTHCSTKKAHLNGIVADLTALVVSFFRCRVERKRGRISRMNPWKTVSMSLVASASLGLADDFKTIDGKVYKDATISHVEADGIVIKTKTGISKIYFVELPKDVQERFHYGSATPTGKAVTQRIDKAESTTQATPFVSAADRFASFVEKKLDERESILKGKHTPGPAELNVRREFNFHWAFLAGTAIIASVLFAIVWARFK